MYLLTSFPNCLCLIEQKCPKFQELGQLVLAAWCYPSLFLVLVLFSLTSWHKNNILLQSSVQVSPAEQWGCLGLWSFIELLLQGYLFGLLIFKSSDRSTASGGCNYRKIASCFFKFCDSNLRKRLWQNMPQTFSVHYRVICMHLSIIITVPVLTCPFKFIKRKTLN